MLSFPLSSNVLLLLLRLLLACWSISIDCPHSRATMATTATPNPSASGVTITYLTQYLRRHPERADAFRHRATELLAASQLEQALADCNAVVMRDPVDPRARVRRSQVLEKIVVDRLEASAESMTDSIAAVVEEMRRRSLDDLTVALLRAPDEPSIRLARAVVSERRGNASMALEDLNVALRVEANDIDALCLRALVLEQLGELTAALHDYNTAISQAPDRINLRNGRALLLAQLGRHREAIADLDLAWTLEPCFPIAYNRAMAYLRLNEFDAAIAAFSEALQLVSTEATNQRDQLPTAGNRAAELYAARGRANFNAARYRDAIGDFDQAIAINQHFAEAYHNRAIAYQALHEYTTAMRDYDTAVSLNPTSGRAYCNRAHAKLRRRAMAVRLQREQPTSTTATVEPHAHHALEDEATERRQCYQDLTRAVELLSDTTAKNPQLDWAFYYLGRAQRLLGRYEQAIATQNRAIALDAAYARAFAERGWAHLSAGHPRQAHDDFAKAVRLLPSRTYLDRSIDRCTNCDVRRV